MEKKIFKPEAGPYPWLLLRKLGQDDRSGLVFINENDPNNNKIVVSCRRDGWLLIVENHQCLLWNALTLESIELPSLDSDELVESVADCLLSPESLIILFFKRRASFMFCRVGDQRWSEQRVAADDDIYGRLGSPVCYNGKLYACAYINGTGSLLLIDLKPSDDGSLVTRLHGSLPRHKDQSLCSSVHMVESCGEIFVIYMIRGGNSSLQVTGAELFKLDSSLMEWIQVKSTKDRVFLLDECAAYSYRVENPETEGNRIYFTLSDTCVYAFDIEQNCLSASLPYPDLKSPCDWGSPIWVTTEHADAEHSQDIVPYSQGDDDNDEEEEAKDDGYLCEVPLDMLSSIASCLMIHDYINFRLVNRTCRLMAPPVRIKELARNIPWLMICKRGEDKCRLIDPLRRVSYVMNTPTKHDDVRMCCSGRGWCLMSQRHDDNPNTIFLWNPFTKEIIPLPNPTHHHKDLILGGQILSSPNSSDCVISLICNPNPLSFGYINVRQQTWETRFTLQVDIEESLLSKTPVFYNGDLCFLDSEGILTMFKPDGFTLRVENPCNNSSDDDIDQHFLLEANGKLVSVFLGFMGEWIKVFELDLSKRLWVEADNVGDKTLYVSRMSSFAVTATTDEMKNTICFPRFHEKNLIYYSLNSRKYHCYGSEFVIQDFYNTKEQLYSCWIEPEW